MSSEKEYFVTTTLVTGGGGFIGSHLIDRLLELGHSVRALDNFSTGRRSNLRRTHAQIELIEGDLRDPDTVRRATQGVDIVLHQGALPSVPRSVSDPRTSNAVNVEGTLNVLLAAREAGVRRVVVASSSSVYGETPTLPKVEAMTPQPRSPYAISKLAAEQYTCAFAALYGLETVALRYFNVFGPRQDPTSQYSGVIARFCTTALLGQPYTVQGDGLQSRDFTYIENVVQANLLAATAPDVSGQVFNIACGERITLLDMITILNRLIGRDLSIEHGPARAGDVRHSLADIGKARKLLGYAPAFDVAEGLARTLAWYRENE
jgi:nucleoside-diphosphate-sugar epimerase